MGDTPDLDLPADIDVEWTRVGDAWVAERFVPGPAGLATASFPSEVTVDVDVADLGQIVGFVVPDWADPARVAPLLVPGLPPTAAIERLATGRIAVARLALAAEALTVADANRDALGEALARVDLALATTGIVDGFPQDQITTALTAVTTVADDLFGLERQELVADTLGLLTRFVISTPVARDALELVWALQASAAEHARVLADTADADAEFPEDLATADVAVAALASPPDPVPAPAAGTLDVVDRATLPEGIDARHIAARATTPSEIELRLTRAPRDRTWWARVTRSDGVTIALSPFRSTSDGLVARVLIPPGWQHDIIVDLTARPDEPGPGPRARQVAAAVRSGREAARDARAGRVERASRRWRATAHAWDQLGDSYRGELALVEAYPRNVNTPGWDPLLSDLPLT